MKAAQDVVVLLFLTQVIYKHAIIMLCNRKSGQIEIEHHAMLMLMKCAERSWMPRAWNIIRTCTLTCLFINRGIVCFTCYH